MGEEIRFVSVARFAELVSLSERTCWNLIRRRQLPVYRIGRRTLVRPDEGVEALVRAGRRRSAPASHR
jgi:predicted DNA-binding transcriptional regulator AlpA